MRIIKTEQSGLSSYEKLKPGSVFRFGKDFKCVGLKMAPKHFVHLQNIFGESTFRQFEKPTKDGVLFEGLLIGVEVGDAN